MKPKNNISPETIKAYLVGTLSHAQTHEFEKAMLNDAVLRDMVEGYEISKDKKVDFQAINDSLSESLTKRLGEEQKEIYPLWKRVPVYVRAASVVLFLGVGFYFLMKNDSSENSEKVVLAQPSDKVNIPKSSPSIIDRNPVIAQEKNAVNKEEMKTEIDKVQSEESIAFEQKKTLKTSREATKTDAIISMADADSKPEQPVQMAEKENVAESESVATYSAKPSSVPVPARAPSAVMQKDEDYAKSRVKEVSSAYQIPSPTTSNIQPRLSNIVILNEDNNKPVPNVSIISENKSLGKTDENGRFSLENVQLGNKINLVAPDFENTEIIINKTTPNLFYIRPKSELIFIDFRRNKTWKYNTAEHSAQPSVSPDDYLEYLQKNLKKPKQAVDKQVVGWVEVEFVVNKKGELLDFRITKSLGFGCDEEAIRLISEGPKWLPKTYGGNTGSQRVRQVVNF